MLLLTNIMRGDVSPSRTGGDMRIQKPADLARLVKTQRHAQGRTQQEVAEAIGITRQSLARVERGAAGVSFHTVLRIFDYLSIRLDAAAGAQPQAEIAAAASAEPEQTVAERSVDSAAIAAAAARSIDTSAITNPAIQNISLSLSSVAAAVGAATRDVDSSAALTSWRSALGELSARLRESTASEGVELSPHQARQAVLNAAIEAGDPNLGNSPDAASPRNPESTGRA